MLEMRGNKITWLGHAGFKFTTATGKVVLIDPWINGPTCPENCKTFDRVDLILATHGHSDHFSDIIPLALKHKPAIGAIFETGMWLGSKNVEHVLPMSKGGTQQAADVAFTMVNANHSNSIVDDGKVIYAGEPAGYIVRLPGGLVVYHAGDTNLFGDMRLIGEMYRPQLALLPIGDVYTMGPHEAAHAIRLLGVRHVIPMHYGTFPLLTGTPAALKAETGDVAGLEIHALKPGESLE
ncbi:MAG: metal-dependent hydrolase [Acidobacteriota bacterium]|nr:metal-dependent hydrolase [Acidobacteriota bacterium]